MVDKTGGELQLTEFYRLRVADFSQRLKYLIGEASVRQFAKDLSVTEAAVRSYLRGETLPKLSVLAEIADVKGVSLVWLAMGDDAYSGGADFVNEPGAHYSTGQLSNRVNRFVVIKSTETLLSGADATPMPEHGLGFCSQWLDQRGLQAEQLSLMAATGDSMAPAINNNDCLLIDHSQQQLNDGQIYLFKTDGHLLVKRVQTLPGKQIKLLSNNPNFGPITVDLSQAADLTVMGRVVWVGQDI